MNKTDKFIDWICGKGEWPFGKNLNEVPMPDLVIDKYKELSFDDDTFKQEVEE